MWADDDDFWFYPTTWRYSSLNHCLHKNWKLSSLTNQHSMELFEMEKERTHICELFLNYERWEVESAHKGEPALYMLCLLKKGPLLMRVPSWWSIGCRRSDGCTCWRGYTYFSVNDLLWQGALSECPSAGAEAAAMWGGTMAERTAKITGKDKRLPWKMAQRGGL